MTARNFESANLAPRALESAGEHASAGGLGVYVHFPYCLKKCPYCDFVSFRAERPEIPHREYADAVIRELEARAGGIDEREVTTIFFGGGTPSLWDPRELGRVLHAISARFDVRLDGTIEITAECNPTSLDEARARELKEVGVNRLSVGVQALDDARLEFLGRLHKADDGLRAIEAALRSGVARVSGDLIFGVNTGAVAESPEIAADEAARVARAGVTHVSAYALTIEPNTEFGALARRGRLPLAPDDLVVDSLFAIESALGELGFEHYETSNYAKPGHEARHNLGYWRGVDYLGLGAGAFGTLTTGGGRAVRYRNASDPRKYMALAARPDELTSEREDLGPTERMNERIMLGLRLAEGIDLVSLAQDLGIDPIPLERARALDRLERDGRIERSGSRIVVPVAKRALVDGISATLFG